MMCGGAVMYGGTERRSYGVWRSCERSCERTCDGQHSPIDLRRKTRPSNRLLWGVCSDTLPQNSPCGLEGMQSLCGSACPEFGAVSKHWNV